jgi:hypothetical protein
MLDPSFTITTGNEIVQEEQQKIDVAWRRAGMAFGSGMKPHGEVLRCRGELPLDKVAFTG